MKFELSEVPEVENTEVIEKEATKVSVQEQKPLTKSVVKMVLNGDPYYHFVKGEFNGELATRNEFFKLGNKTYYKGLINNKSHITRRLNNK